MATICISKASGNNGHRSQLIVVNTYTPHTYKKLADKELIGMIQAIKEFHPKKQIIVAGDLNRGLDQVKILA